MFNYNQDSSIVYCTKIQMLLNVSFDKVRYFRYEFDGFYALFKLTILERVVQKMNDSNMPTSIVTSVEI